LSGLDRDTGQVLGGGIPAGTDTPAVIDPAAIGPIPVHVPKACRHGAGTARVIHATIEQEAAAGGHAGRR